MSHGSGDEDNYWPGYVDALTSMVQVLAFVMMMLAMAVFVLSQSVSKSAVEAIAKAVNAQVKPDSTVSQLTQSVIDQLDKMRKTGGETSPQQAQSQALPDPTDQTENSRPSEMRVVSQRSQSSRAAVKAAPDSPRVVIAFDDRSFRIEQDGTAEIAKFAAENAAGAARGLLITAYAFTGEGALTEARRIAYYRAMMARKYLAEAKVPLDKVRINVLDTTDRVKGSTIEIVVAGEDTP